MRLVTLSAWSSRSRTSCTDLGLHPIRLVAQHMKGSSWSSRTPSVGDPSTRATAKQVVLNPAEARSIAEALWAEADAALN